MPTYDYECDACHHKFELYQGINDDKKKKCPECGKNKAERIISAGGGIIFKGSGFYQTDYRSDSYKKGATADKNSQDSPKSESSSSDSSSKASDSSGSKSSSAE